jgi:hypothetical protein
MRLVQTCAHRSKSKKLRNDYLAIKSSSYLTVQYTYHPVTLYT